MDTGDESLGRDQSLSGRLSEIHQERHSTAENLNLRHIPPSVDDPSRMEVDEHIPDTPAVTTRSEHFGDTLMEAMTLGDSTFGNIQRGDEEASCRIDVNIGD